MDIKLNWLAFDWNWFCHHLLPHVDACRNVSKLQSLLQSHDFPQFVWGRLFALKHTRILWWKTYIHTYTYIYIYRYVILQYIYNVYIFPVFIAMFGSLLCNVNSHPQTPGSFVSRFSQGCMYQCVMLQKLVTWIQDETLNKVGPKKQFEVG